jgi:hypothetical protein
VKLLIACLVATGCTSSDATARFTGTWNYDQPDRARDRNIGKVLCPAQPPIIVPQIGNIVIEPVDGHTIEGRTDQGCTWRFAVDGDTAQLSPQGQTCFNHVIGSSYTLDWSMTVAGDRETEVISGTSHLPGGECRFELASASRTRVDPGTGDATAGFIGTWRYDPADPATGANLEIASCGGPPSVAPVVGTLAIARTSDHQIQAISDAGCAWTFSVAGNTAELDPVPQSCAASHTTLAFWSIASDGQRANAVASGERDRDGARCKVLMSAGSLARQ